MALAGLREGQVLSQALVQATFAELEVSASGDLASAASADLALGALLAGLAHPNAAALSGAALGLGQQKCVAGAPALLNISSTRTPDRGLRDLELAAALVAASLGHRLWVDLAQDPKRLDLLELLGIPVHPKIDVAASRWAQDRIAFVQTARTWHLQAQRNRVRAALGMPTLLDFVAPLLHPASPTHHCVAVFDAEHTEPMARALGQLGAHRALVLQGVGSPPGIAAFCPEGPTRVALWQAGVLSCFELRPALFGVQEHGIGELAGEDPQENARALRDLFDGARNAYRDAVICTGALALWVASEDDRGALAGYADRVRHALDSGLAAQKLSALTGHANSSP